MPFYDYECAEHGVFEQMRSFAESSSPIGCPVCEQPATRVYAAPMTRLLSPATRKAIDRNVTSQHQPHVCSSGCNHRPSGPAGPGPKPKRISYTGPRPWVIEHA